jgi:hypothetical protein
LITLPLSPVAQKALEDSARISNENKAKKQAQADQAEGERKQNEQDYNSFIAEQAEIQKQIDQLEAQEKAIKEEEAKEEARKQGIIDQRNAINLKYSTQINDLIAQKNNAIANMPRTESYYISKKGADGHYYKDWGNTRALSRSQLQVQENIITRNYNARINEISRQRTKESQAFEFSVQYPGGVLGGSARRTYEKSGGQISLIALYERQQNAFEAKKQAQRQTAINQSKSQISQGRTHFQNVADSFTQKKEEENKKRLQTVIFNKAPTKAGDLKQKATPPARSLFQVEQKEIPLNIGALKSYQATQQAKATKLKEVMATRQKIEPIQAPTKRPDTSNAFLTKAPVYASSIIGTTTAKSDQAVFTFEETQTQQAELSDKLRNAKSAREATKIKEEYQAINPFVGTPQTARTKEGTAQQGVLIDLKLNIDNDKAPLETTIEEPKTETPGETITTYNITVGDRTLTGIKDKETADKILARLNQTPETKIPQYNFVDEQGNKYTPTVAQLFSYNNYLLNQVPPLPSVQDKAFNKILQENPQAFSFDPSLASGETKQVNIENTYAVANKDPVNRGILNTVVNPNETVLGKGIEDVIAVGSSTVNNKPLPEKSEVINFIDTKIKTDEGRKELIGEGIGEYFLARVFSGAPSLISKAYHSGIIQPKTLKIAEEIAEQIRFGGRDPATEKLIAKFPDMPASMKNELRNKANKETVGIELLDSRTALIKRGTELNEVQTPYIIVKNSKNPHSKLYETYTQDKPGAYSKILISGEQGKELKGGIKQNKDIVEYPATRDNVITTDKLNKLATVGTSEKVGLQGMKETPLAVIEKIETQEIKTGSIILETQRLNKIKSMNKDTAGLNKADDIPKTNTKPFKPDTGSPGNKINVDIPTKSNTAKLIGDNPTQRRERLETIIKNTNKEPINIKMDNLNKLSSISIITSTQATRSIQGTSATQRTEGATAQQQQTQTAQQEKTVLDSGLKEASQLRTDTISGLKTDLETTHKNKPTIDPKYSLITKPGLKDKTGTIPILGSDLGTTQDQTFELVLKQEQTPKIPTPTKTTTRTTTTRPGLPISLNIDERKEVKPKAQGGKLKISYYRYNVNTDSVGRYIEQAPDISTGGNKKVITKIDNLEKKINSRSYKAKRDKQEKKSFKRSLVSYSKPKGSLNSRGFIPNITEPKGKKAKKALKKLGFKLDIF